MPRIRINPKEYHGPPTIHVVNTVAEKSPRKMETVLKLMGKRGPGT
ncbi:MAG: hypothetical protein OEZ51_02775 [Nitrospinota bacterium]|nr:hypothetical protein [Nitrospinota bacterium]